MLTSSNITSRCSITPIGAGSRRCIASSYEYNDPPAECQPDVIQNLNAAL